MKYPVHPFDAARVRKCLTVVVCTVVTAALVIACGGSTEDSAVAARATASQLVASSPTASTGTQPPATTAEPSTAPAHSSATVSTATRATATRATATRATATRATATPTAPATTATPTEASRTAHVEILDFRFDPPVLEIDAGTTVTFVNRGVDHTATAREDPGIFDTGILHTGESFTVTLDAPGTIEYWCLLHPDMVATIVVRP